MRVDREGLDDEVGVVVVEENICLRMDQLDKTAKEIIVSEETEPDGSGDSVKDASSFVVCW